MPADELKTAACAANQAAERFAARGEADEWAISRLMADRYTRQLTEEETRS